MGSGRILDCIGFACPQPVIKTMDALTEMQSGEDLQVIVDNEGSCSNVIRFAESQGHAASFQEKEGNYRINITKGAVASSQPELEIVCDIMQQKNIFVYVASEFMGRGDDELGRILMQAYFETLSHFAKDITHIAFVNSGVKLAIEGSAVLDYIKEMEQMGIAVLCCGTCLNHFDSKDKLAVGQVSNMFSILDAQSKAGTILSP
jgi:selenium metabolism protein YedF